MYEDLTEVVMSVMAMPLHVLDFDVVLGSFGKVLAELIIMFIG